MSIETLILPATESTPPFSRERSPSLAHGIVAIGSSSGRTSKTPIASALDAVTFELFKLGAIPLERFETEDYPEETVVPDKPIAAAAIGGPVGDGASGVKTNFQAVAKIYEACMRTFGNSDPIKWEFMMELGPNSKECILTITRPNGLKRSYTSGALFAKKTEAKACAASVALDMSVIDFIMYGDADAKTRAGIVVDSLDAQPKFKVEEGKGTSFMDVRETEVDDSNVKAIENCLQEWRAGTIKPVYIHFAEPTIVPKLKGKAAKRQPQPIPTEQELEALKQGCALRIEVSQHTVRVYSVHHVHATRAEAKAAVADLAIKQGILEFIKHANGQTEPMVFINELDGDANENLNRDVIEETAEPEKEVNIEATAVNVTLKRHQIPLNAMTLQGFTNALPKPLPETPGLKPIGDGNPVGWINTAVQMARGSKMGLMWTYLSNAKLSLHGCLLRFTLPRESEGRSYLVEPIFSKRSDAKSAVALHAISQGVGTWIKSVGDAVENLITPEMRGKAQSLIGPLSTECTRAGIQGHPVYTYAHEDGAVGCTLKVEFRPDLSRTWTVPVQYRTKPDARFAVVLQAHMEGIIEFIRFKGESPPEGYNSELPFDWKIAKKIAEARARGEDLALLKQDDVEKRPPFRRLHYDGSRYGSGRGGFGNNMGAGAFRGHGARGGPPNRAGGYHNNPGAFVPQGSFTPISPGPDRRPSFPGPGAPQPWEAPGYGEHGPSPAPMGPPNIPAPPMGVVPYGPNPPAPVVHPHSHVPSPMPPPPPPHYMHPGFNGYAPPSNLNPFGNPVPPNPVYTNPLPGPMPSAPVYPQPHVVPPVAYPQSQSPHPGYPQPPEPYTNQTGYHGLVPAPPPPGPPQFHGPPHSHPPPFPGPPPQRNAPQRSPRGRSTSHTTLTRRPEQKPQASRKSTTGDAQSKEVSVKIEEVPANPSALLSELRRDVQLSKKRPRASSPPPENVSNGKYVTALTAHCVKTGAKLPVFKHATADKGKFKVWVIMDRERLELPITYDDIETGKEKVAKQVLARARGLAKKQRVGGHEETTASKA